MAMQYVRLPEREKVQKVRDIFVGLGGDLDHPDVIPAGCWKAVRKAGVTNTRWPQWLEPRYDPYLDEVALERALNGDITVLDNLTHYERQEFITRLDVLARKWHAEWMENQAHRASADGVPDAKGTQLFGSKRWGFLMKTVTKRRERSLASAAA